MTGRFPKPIADVTDFPRWMQRVWPILTQRHTKLLANGNIKEPGGEHFMDDETITCTRIAVSSSFKPWLFTGAWGRHYRRRRVAGGEGAAVPAVVCIRLLSPTTATDVLHHALQG